MIAQHLADRLRELGDEWEVTIWLRPVGMGPMTSDYGGCAPADQVTVLPDSSGLGGSVVELEDRDGDLTLIPESEIRRITVERAG